MTTPLRPVRRLADDTRNRLREMILAGELPAGARLGESQLAEALGVSRTPVREAISQLAAEGLVVRDGGVPQVGRLTIDDVMDILYVRLLLEPDAARRAAQSPRHGEFIQIRQTFAEFLQGPRPEPAAHFEADLALHLAVARAAGSALVEDLVASLKSRTRMFGQRSIPGRFADGCREHLAIIDAILARDGAAAEDAMRAHLDNTRNAILDHLTGRY